MTDETSLLPASVATPKIDAAALAYALARNTCGAKLPLTTVLTALNVDTNAPGLRNLLTSVTFKQRYATYVRELTESGESFKLKARVQAEELLATQWAIIQSPNTPANVRMDGIKSLVEWGGLKPEKKTEDKAATQISITIDLGGDKHETIDVTPEDVAAAVALTAPT